MRKSKGKFESSLKQVKTEAQLTNLRDTMKGTLKCKFRALVPLLKNFKWILEWCILRTNKSKNRPKVNRRKEITKIRAKISKIQAKNFKRSIKTWFSEKRSKTDKLLARKKETRLKYGERWKRYYNWDHRKTGSLGTIMNNYAPTNWETYKEK